MQGDAAMPSGRAAWDAGPFSVSREPNLSRRFLRRKASNSVPVPERADALRRDLLWARNGIYWALHALGVGREDEILAPSYICRAALDPAEHLGSRVTLYRITGECRVDLADLRARISPRAKAVIAAHYFGFPTQIGEIREICDARGLLLIEDCAHVLTGTSGGRSLGSFGDASVFSWRKVLPVFDGAHLIVSAPVRHPLPRMARQPLPMELRTLLNLAARAATQESAPALLQHGMRLISWLVSRRPKGMGGNAARPEMSAVDFSAALSLMPMSRVSAWLLRHSDLETIAARRRENYRRLAGRLSGIPRIRLLHPELQDPTCPWILPMFVDGIPDAHFALRRQGIPAVTWGQVRPPQLRKGDFPEADHLYDNLVFLPVHQDMTDSHLDRIIHAVRNIPGRAV